MPADESGRVEVVSYVSKSVFLVILLLCVFVAGRLRERVRLPGCGRRRVGWVRLVRVLKCV